MKRVLTIALFLAVPQFTSAACEPSQRVHSDDSNCLEAQFVNRTWPAKDEARARNLCSDLGALQVKVDRAHAADGDMWLPEDGWIVKSWQGTISTGYIRGIYCCEDESDLCNRPDPESPTYEELTEEDREQCIADFNQSPAVTQTEGQIGSTECELTSAAIEFVGSANHKWCRVHATCMWERPACSEQQKRNGECDRSGEFNLRCPLEDVIGMTFSDMPPDPEMACP